MSLEGMVHALKSIHRLLAPGGLLLDIHPTDEPAGIYLGRGRSQQFIAWLEETDGYEEYRQADRAVAQALQNGLYRLEQHSFFWFTIYAASLPELEQFLKQEWKDAVIPAQAWQQLQSLQSGKPPGKIRLRERIQINLLAPTAALEKLEVLHDAHLP
jgi:hypothetical protein